MATTMITIIIPAKAITGLVAIPPMIIHPFPAVIAAATIIKVLPDGEVFYSGCAALERCAMTFWEGLKPAIKSR